MFKIEKIIIILCFTVSVGRFALDSYLPSLPGIAFYFGSTTSETELTLTLYLLGFGLSQFIYGPLSDRFGRRPIILISFVIFILSSVICTFADSLDMLILGRLLAGIGAGASTTLSRAIVSDTYCGTYFAKAWSQITTVIIISLAVSPLIGGYIQELLGWRYVFFIATLYASLVLILLFFVLPETLQQKNLDALQPAVMIKNYGHLLKHPQSMAYVLCYTLSFAGLMAYFQVSPILFIVRLDLSPTVYGWFSLCVALAYLIGGISVTRLGGRLGINRMMGIGIGLIICSGFIMIMTTFFMPLNVYNILLPAMVYVIGTRIIVPNALAGSMAHFRHMAGYAASFSAGTQMLGSALVSYCITQVPYKSLFLLGAVYFVLGLLCLTLFYSMILNIKRKPSSRSNGERK
jgi:Bcr/CflA subfamily drug resistance transporter